MENVYDFITKKTGLRYNDTVVLGVSGGPDSMALLHLYKEVSKEMDIELVCAHVNHNLRKESAEEQVFLEKYCNRNGIIFECIKIDNWGDDNFHNEARTVRYKFFESLVLKYGAKFLVTAHHGDDLIETILMRMVRGSTLKGYSGFSKVIDKNDYRIIRPLVSVTKDEILKYVKKEKIEYRVDITNTKDVYTRNRYRKYVLPFLKNEDENVHLKFLKFSEILLEYNNYIDKQIVDIKKEIVNNNSVKIEELLKLDHILQVKIIYSLLEDTYNDDLMIISDAHVDLIFKLLKSTKANATVHLPNNIIASKTYDVLLFTEKIELNEAYEIEINDIANLPNGKNISVEKECNITTNFCTRLSSKEVEFPLFVRTRQNGDKMQIKGMLGSKKINNIFMDEKISMGDRELWPIVCDATGKVVWLPGLKKSKFDKAKNEVYDIILRYY